MNKKSLIQNPIAKGVACGLAALGMFAAGFGVPGALTGYLDSVRYGSVEETEYYLSQTTGYTAMAWQQYLRETYPGEEESDRLQSQQIAVQRENALKDSGYYYQIVRSDGTVVAGNLSSSVSKDQLTEVGNAQPLGYFYRFAYGYSGDERLGSGWVNGYGDYQEEDDTTVVTLSCPSAYYCLEENDTMTEVDLHDTAALDAAMEEGNLFVLEDPAVNVLYRVTARSLEASREDGVTLYQDVCEADANAVLFVTIEGIWDEEVSEPELYTWDGQGDIVPVSGLLETVNQMVEYNCLLVMDQDRLYRVNWFEADVEEDELVYHLGYSAFSVPTVEGSDGVFQAEANPVEEAITADTHTYYLRYGVLPVNGTTTVFDRLSELYSSQQEALTGMIALGVVSLLVTLLAVIFLCVGAGHRKDDEMLQVQRLNPWDRIWLEPALAVWVAGGVGAGAITFELLRYWNSRYARALLVAESLEAYQSRVLLVQVLLGAILAACTLWTLPLLLSVVRRLKTRSFWKSTLLGWLGGRIWRGIKALWRMILQNLPLSGMAAGVFALYLLIVYLAPPSLALLLGIAGAALIVVWCLNFDALRKGIDRLNRGETEAEVDTRRMLPVMRETGEALNNLSEGIQKAVEKQMQSERFKAELITNVSHDLKTPLTSIINYVDLLKKTEITDTQALEYLEVLDRKSQRLKKLTEDLVEASKASTGAVKLDLTRLDFSQLTGQALAEYEEKLETAGLQTVLNMPEPPVTVLADGRHLWRVLDNLLNNCCKYALAGTRVYITMQKREGVAELEMKNISALPLNIKEEELLERFVRGDASRSTEGSGLGLNIAASLLQLMGGQFRIVIDGDLFKAVVTLPLQNETADEN